MSSLSEIASALSATKSSINAALEAKGVTPPEKLSGVASAIASISQSSEPTSDYWVYSGAAPDHNISIPDGTTSVRGYIAYGTDATSMTIPVSADSVDENACTGSNVRVLSMKGRSLTYIMDMEGYPFGLGSEPYYRIMYGAGDAFRPNAETAALYPVVVEDWDGLCFTAAETSTIAMEKTGSPGDISLKYSINGREWVNWDLSAKKLYKGDRMYVSAVGSPGTLGNTAVNNCYKFVMTGSVAASGDIMSLLDETMQLATVPDYGFAYLFLQCTALTAAPSLSAAVTVGKFAYTGMFTRCSSMTSPPADLPAGVVSEAAYSYMFQYCTALETAPSIEATRVGLNGCAGMFMRCESLTTGPFLRATSVANSGYYCMFYGCSSLSSIKVAASLDSIKASSWLISVAEQGTYYVRSGEANYGKPSTWSLVTYYI